MSPKLNEMEAGLDAALFARELLGFRADAKQAELLRCRAGSVILNCTRQWGKSTVTAAKAVHTAVFRPGSLTLVISPSQRQSAELVRKAARFVGALGWKVRGDGDNEVSLALPNESRIVGLPGVESTARGFSAAELLLVDEAARVDEDLYAAMRPVLAVSDGSVWLMSTPCGRRGFFFETWEKGGPEWKRVRVPATECPRISQKFLERERKTMTDRRFRQEYLCEFGENAASVFSERLIREAIKPGIERLNFDDVFDRFQK